jgi:hypothetical protein
MGFASVNLFLLKRNFSSFNFSRQFDLFLEIFSDIFEFITDRIFNKEFGVQRNCGQVLSRKELFFFPALFPPKEDGSQ